MNMPTRQLTEYEFIGPEPFLDIDKSTAKGIISDWTDNVIFMY